MSEQDKRRLSKTEFDILEILYNHYPNRVSGKQMASELRERGYDVTSEELEEIFKELSTDFEIEPNMEDEQ